MATALFAKRVVARPEELAPLRTAVWSHARGLGASEQVANAVRAAVGEALANIVMHAYVDREPGPMMVEAWLDENECFIVRVHDDGLGLVPRCDSPGLGLGLGIMAQMTDDFRVANREGTPGTTVSMRFSLRRSVAQRECGQPVV